MGESDTVYEGLGERFANIKLRINQALLRSNRPADDVTLIAITKTHPAETIQELIKLGATDLGENRIQEAEAKIETSGRGKARWHLVGHLAGEQGKTRRKAF